jgi:tRNA (guanine37-N1)-methyltransferase
LLSGNHRRVQVWRRTQSIRRTLERRPDLLEKACLSETDKCILEELKQKQGKPLHTSNQESDPDE